MNQYAVFEYAIVSGLDLPIQIRMYTNGQLNYNFEDKQNFLATRRLIVHAMLKCVMSGVKEDEFILIYVKHGGNYSQWYSIDDGFLEHNDIVADEWVTK